MRLALRAAAGFLAGLALWVAAFPAYGRLLAEAAEPVLRFLERPHETRLYAEERRLVIDRADFASRSDRPSLPVDDLTFNVILFLTLSATRRRLFRDRGLLSLLAALGILGLTHVVAVVVAVKAFYATQLGEWSAAYYGPLSRNFWAGAGHFYRLAGCWAIAFVLWWALVRPEVSAEASTPGRRGPRRGPRRVSRPRGRD
ncbi:MAG: hypothetical protein ACHQPI_07430 [Thermoanaerobaculia bacterium]